MSVQNIVSVQMNGQSKGRSLLVMHTVTATENKNNAILCHCRGSVNEPLVKFVMHI